MFIFSGENIVNSTNIATVNKQLMSNKSKKKTKHMFCIVNDVHDCCQARQQIQLEDDDDTTTENNMEGLSDLLTYNIHKMRDFVDNMESKIRLGDCNARWKMQKVLPLQCFSQNYPRIFNVLNQNSSTYQQTTYIHIQMLPEITILLHQCMMPTKQYEDDLIILI